MWTKCGPSPRRTADRSAWTSGRSYAAVADPLRARGRAATADHDPDSPGTRATAKHWSPGLGHRFAGAGRWAPTAAAWDLPSPCCTTPARRTTRTAAPRITHDPPSLV